MDLKGITDLKNAFCQIHSDLLFLRPKIVEDNNGIYNEINLLISFVRQNENFIEKNSLINELQSSTESSSLSSLEVETLWKCYKEILFQIFPSLNGINGLLLPGANKNQLNGGKNEKKL